ncbi:hypothetical protein [Sinomonas mesophila]|uniref:hypothetical protein n=1 Tax=Sinomonas mesophila TaxID=1531955 RepID=UPI00098766BC|nr:hypothetical protein [Sinomonas mesophila]
MNPGLALASGLAAGLAVAVPLGAVGVLLIREGIERGLRGGLPAATAVAAVDLLYAAAAVVLGAVAAPLVAHWDPYPALAGGAALLAIAAAGLARSLSRGSAPSGTAAVLRSGPQAAGLPEQAAAGVPVGRCLRRFAMFFGLTLVNPATLVCFAAMAAGLPQLSGDPAAGAAFVAGAGVASFAWQALLVVGGGLLSGRSGPGLRRASGIVGSAAVGIFGLLLVAGAVL